MCTLLVGLSASVPAAAQSPLAVGPRVGFDVANVEELLVGAEARLPFRSQPVALQSALDVYLPARGSFVTLSVNALYRFPVAHPRIRPYAGAGLGFSFYDDATGQNPSDTGLNLVGGLRFPSSSALTPFVQTQVTLGTVDLIALSGGFLLDV
ncbi:MAG: hypothetical protein GVY35_09530 [Bacteroidetes bacterium]|nr:hypothetical protein [Bacteroidota bacterium]